MAKNNSSATHDVAVKSVDTPQVEALTMEQQARIAAAEFKAKYGAALLASALTEEEYQEAGSSKASEKAARIDVLMGRVAEHKVAAEVLNAQYAPDYVELAKLRGGKKLRTVNADGSSEGFKRERTACLECNSKSHHAPITCKTALAALAAKSVKKTAKSAVVAQ